MGVSNSPIEQQLSHATVTQKSLGCPEVSARCFLLAKQTSSAAPPRADLSLIHLAEM